MNATIPRQVPLPEVTNYTDNIVFGNLGLPVGFDTERLTVNLRAIERIRFGARLGHISVVGENTFNNDEPVYQIDGTGPDGTAYASGAVSREKNPLSATTIQFPSPYTILGSPNVTIRFNKDEAAARVKENDKEHTKGPFDARVRAKYLNGALKTGLTEASKLANVDRVKIGGTFLYYGFINGCMVALSSWSPEVTSLAVAGVAPLFLNTVMGMHILEQYDPTSNPIQQHKELRQSLFFGCAFDRYAVGAGLAKSSKLIRART